tara:strand:+ start:187 stop:591 length:405 start_codon:yes stop_codon:yes gene_type:complete
MTPLNNPMSTPHDPMRQTKDDFVTNRLDYLSNKVNSYKGNKIMSTMIRNTGIQGVTLANQNHLSIAHGSAHSKYERLESTKRNGFTARLPNRTMNPQKNENPFKPMRTIADKLSQNTSTYQWTVPKYAIGTKGL